MADSKEALEKKQVELEKDLTHLTKRSNMVGLSMNEEQELRKLLAEKGEQLKNTKECLEKLK